MIIGKCYANPPTFIGLMEDCVETEQGWDIEKFPDFDRPEVRRDGICRFWTSKIVDSSPTTDNMNCGNCLYFREESVIE